MQGNPRGERTLLIVDKCFDGPTRDQTVTLRGEGERDDESGQLPRGIRVADKSEYSTIENTRGRRKMGTRIDSRENENAAKFRAKVETRRVHRRSIGSVPCPTLSRALLSAGIQFIEFAFRRRKFKTASLEKQSFASARHFRIYVNRRYFRRAAARESRCAFRVPDTHALILSIYDNRKPPLNPGSAERDRPTDRPVWYVD